jgi:hypothetical protein
MRMMTSSLLAGCIGLALIADAPAAPWTSAKIPGEQERAVQGCADNPPGGEWLCIIVRCDHPRSPVSLYFTAPAPDITGDIALMVDDTSFALSVPTSLKSPLPLSTRARAVPANLLEAMKAGHTLSIEGSYVQPPHNQISLENSRTAIERVEYACGSGPFGGAATFWRRLRRSVGFY